MDYHKVSIKYKNDDVITLEWHGQVFDIYLPASSSEELNDIIREVFGKCPYCLLDVKYSTVIDVGAGVGDTILLFDALGAKRIIALEPYPYMYNIAKKTVELNHWLVGRVTLLLAGMGSKDATVKVGNCKTKYGDRFDPSKCPGDTEVRIYTLESLLKELNLENNDDLVLKSDCEGCEYDFILNAAPSTLAKFKAMAIEYHADPWPLASKLWSSGFHTIVLRPWIDNVGYIYALRTIDRLYTSG